MPRYKLTIEYDGTPFVGWQLQENGPSVQGRLAEAIEAFSGEDIVPRGAGRTDAGVHALGQAAHMDLAKDWEPDKIRDALNAQLRPDPDQRCSLRAHAARISTPASRRPPAIISTVSSIAAAPLALERMRAWGVFRAPRCRGDARSRAGSGRQSRLHHLPLDRMPGEVAGEDARPVGGLPPWRDHPHRNCPRARSCTTRCARWSAR